MSGVQHPHPHCIICGGAIFGKKRGARTCSTACARRHKANRVAAIRGIRSCKRCGATIQPRARPRAIYCSADCATAANLDSQLRYYWDNKTARDAANRNRARRTAERMRTDPTFAAETREKRREWAALRRTLGIPAEQLARNRAWQAAWYVANRDVIQASRRARVEAMTPEERAAHDDNLRWLNRDWARRRRNSMTAEEKAAARDTIIERRRQRELRLLLGIERNEP